ncbi:hypothetical protein EAO76_01885 [Streptomyces sp. sk2.1]|nr:hypothetical protein EAO76_01885 [Streptomyces sp. sk2.1]
MPRPRKYTSDPGRWPACVRCGDGYPKPTRWPEGLVCRYCVRAARTRQGTCAHCGHQGILPGVAPDSRFLCAQCSDVPLDVHCKRCGDETMTTDQAICWRCLLAVRVSTLLAGPDGAIPEPLQPLAQAIINMPRPNTGCTWINQNPRVRELLRGLADGTIALSHEALDGLPASRTVEYLRGLLVTHGCLPPRDEHLASFDRWLTPKLDAIKDPDQRRLIERYSRWHLKRRLRDQARTAPVTVGAFLRAKQHLTVATQFLHWLGNRGRRLDECTQHDIDAWFSNGTTTRQHANSFLYWAIRQRLVRNITLPLPTSRTSPLASEDEHLNTLRALLLHDTLPAAHRAIGLMLVLFGQPLSRIVQLRTDQLRDGAEGLQVSFGSNWLNVPEPAAAVIRVHLTARPGLNTAANPSSQLLFPGFMPGRPMHVYAVANILRAIGIRPLAARSRAWLQMVREAPPSVLASALGISAATAMRYAERAGTDYLAYASIAKR